MRKLSIFILGIVTIYFTSVQIKAMPAVGWFGTSIWDSYTSLNDMGNEDLTDSGYYLFCVPKEETIFLEDYGFRYLEIDTELELPFSEYELEDLSLYYLRESKKGDTHFRNLFDDLIKKSKYKGFIPITVYGVHFLKYYDYKLHEPEFIECPNEYSFKLSQTKTISYLLTDFLAYDIIDGYLNSTNLTVIHDEYTNNMKKTGKYNVTIEATNSVGNSVQHSFTIEIINDTLPTITSPSNYYISSSFEMDNKFILDAVHAKDFHGESLEVKFKKDEYLLSKNPGEYLIEFSVMDENLQETTLTSNINVLNSTIPFFTSDCSNIIFNKYIDLTEQELIDVLIILKPNNSWKQVNVSSFIQQGIGYNYVYYETLDENNNISEDRLTFHFLDADPVIEVVPVLKEQSYDFVFIIAIVIISLGITGYIAFTQIKKKST